MHGQMGYRVETTNGEMLVWVGKHIYMADF